MHPLNVGKLANRDYDLASLLVPCTAKGILRLLDNAGIALEGRLVAVVGRSNIVGLPMLHLLSRRNATAILCHSRTCNLEQLVHSADVVVVATGSPELVRGSWIRPGAVVVDVGINSSTSGQLVGDTCFDEVVAVAGAVTPVPGGAGPMTVAMLVENVWQAAQRSRRTSGLLRRREAFY